MLPLRPASVSTALALSLVGAAAFSTSAGRPAQAGGATIQVENGAGAPLFTLDPSPKGFHVAGAGGRKLGDVKVESDRVKAANAAGQPAFKVKRKDAGFKLYREPAAPGGADTEIAGYSPEGGDFRVKDGSDREVYRGKQKDGKTKVSGPGGRTYVLKTKDDGMEVEDAAGKRLVRIKGLKSQAAALFCAAPEYDTLQKAAVVAYSARIGR